MGSKILATYMQTRREIVDNMDFYFEDIKSKDLVVREMLYSLENAKRSIKYFTVSYASQAYKKGYMAGDKELMLESEIPNPSKYLGDKIEEYLSEFFYILKKQLLQSLNKKKIYMMLLPNSLRYLTCWSINYYTCQMDF